LFAVVLRPHPSAPLEYWFFKVNHQRIALLVDWICRRKQATGVIRISIHSPTGREVLFSPHPAILRHGAPELAMEETAWPRGNVRWHLSLQPAPDRVRPQIFPAEQLRLFDMSLESAPTVTFNGWIAHRGEKYPIIDALGMVSHYWGRGLPIDWWWISANQFNVGAISVECTILRTRIWGTPVHVPLGYLYYRNGSRSRCLISPPARLTVVGTPDAFEITAVSLRGPQVSLRAKARDYASLGDNIINTLTGDLELWEGGELVAQARGTAALERGAGSSKPSA